MTDKPRLENAPGLTWNRRAKGWEARWQARTDLVKRGWKPKSLKLWVGEQLTPTLEAYIRDRCNEIQSEMRAWGRDDVSPAAAVYAGTLASLAACYTTDPDSNFRKLRYKTREHYETLLRKLTKSHGDKMIADIKAREILSWHRDWMEGGKVTIAHATIGMLRTIINFGSVFLECPECSRVSVALHNMRFKNAKPRTATLSAEQANMIRAAAHAEGLPSIALAQAFQFDGILRQKDVIGEWVPISEPGVSDVTDGNDKWLRGIRWEEIDENLVLRHMTSKRDKMIEIPLSAAPMVMEEFAKLGELPKKGPVIVFERKQKPYNAYDFRRFWRRLANKCGIPNTVRSMDSRAGAITEATDAGADLEHIRHAATHGDIAMTQRYSRGGEAKTANVLRQRVEHRNKSGK